MHNDGIIRLSQRMVDTPMHWRKTLKNKNLLVIVLFFLFLAVLFFISATMDVRRTKSLLLNMAESKGTAVIETLEAVVRERHDSLFRKPGSPPGPVTDFADIETQFRIKEAAIERLIDSAKELDSRFSTRPPTNEILKDLSEAFSVKGILFLDADEHILRSSLPLQGIEAPWITGPAAKQNDLYIDVDLKDPDSKKTHWVGIKRETKPGRIFLMIGRQELDRLMLRVIYQEVIPEAGRQKGVRYLLLINREGRFIAGSEGIREEVFQKILSGSKFPLTAPGDSVFRHIRWDDSVMDVFLPLETGMPQYFTGIVGIDITQVQDTANRNMIHAFIFTGIIICSAGLVLIFVYRIQTRYNERLRKLNMQLAQAERLSSLGRLAAGVAHEIRNPLNAVSMAVQRIFREFKPPGDQKAFSSLVSIIRDEIDRLNRILETFIEPARIKPGKLKPFSLTDLLSPVVSLAREAADPKGIEIVFKPPGTELIVSMDEPRLRQAVWNFLKNAVESIPEKGRISITASDAGNTHAQIQISDTGTGIGSKALKRVLEFEYTTKEKGLGLGLPIAREIILAHDGQLKIDSTPGIGTTVRVLLPLDDKSRRSRK